MPEQKTHPGSDSKASVSAPIAVIDIGSTAVRMAIAQENRMRKISILENLQQEVSLGDDVFSRGVLEPATIEECVRALNSFRKVMQEYGVEREDQIRAVATNAAREASNREAFLDRIYSATGINVSAIEDAEVNRYTYLSLQPVLEKNAQLKKGSVFIIEISGGSTEVLVLQRGHLKSSHSYRLGSFRVREIISGEESGGTHFRELIENEIQRTVHQISRIEAARRQPEVLVLGGDARFAASQLLPDWNKEGVARILLSSLVNFTEKILKMSVDNLVHRYHLSYSEAETLGPALLTYVTLVKALKRKYLFVSVITMREGIIREMTAANPWTRVFQEQVISSAVELGRKYDFDEKHGRHVSLLCQKLFKGLEEVTGLAPRYELILRIAALLHETGLFISNRSHHKHSMYLILNSNLFGLSGRDLLLAALTARYHRKALPRQGHAGFSSLDRDGRIAVSKMAALLRVADSLDDSYKQRIKSFEVGVSRGRVVLSVPKVLDLTLEKHALNTKGNMFQAVFGMEVVLKRV
jgi:exopolyphosphatase/guanosine-5'-triphosphate,3'-diphosphate pyrophosphatase